MRMQRGFTLIELLAVVSIIAVLSAVVMTTLTGERAKSRDARRLADLAQIQKALELYYAQNSQYPAFNAVSTPTGADCTAGGSSNDWFGLETALAPYISKLPRDPAGAQSTYQYFYDSDSGQSNKMYGLMARLEHSINYGKVANDGGYYTGSSGTTGLYFEVGEQPSYCMTRGYAGGNANWWGSGTNACVGGN